MTVFHFRCCECGAAYGEHDVRLVCPTCARAQAPGGPIRGVLEVELEELPSLWPPIVPRGGGWLAAFLPVAQPESLPALPVGGTPLLEVRRLRGELGMPRLWVKDDTRNPSGSTKDRASVLVVAKAMEYGYDTIATASTGNAATALAAVAASSGVRAVVLVPAAAPHAKLVQMAAYGADVVLVDGSYDQAFDVCLDLCEELGWYNRSTALNPFTIEGKKTAALEMALDLAPEVPDVVLVPTGDGVILAGVAKGFADLRRAGLIASEPRLIAVQPEGSSAIASALRSGAAAVTPVPGAASVADSLTVETPRNALLCLRRVRESGGAGVVVSDEAIVEAIGELARTTGVFAEPAGAAALAGLRAALDEGLVRPDECVVLLVTGTGLKDVPAAARGVRLPDPVAPDVGAVAGALGIR